MPRWCCFILKCQSNILEKTYKTHSYTSRRHYNSPIIQFVTLYRRERERRECVRRVYRTFATIPVVITCLLSIVHHLDTYSTRQPCVRNPFNYITFVTLPCERRGTEQERKIEREREKSCIYLPTPDKAPGNINLRYTCLAPTARLYHRNPRHPLYAQHVFPPVRFCAPFTPPVATAAHCPTAPLSHPQPLQKTLRCSLFTPTCSTLSSSSSPPHTHTHTFSLFLPLVQTSSRSLSSFLPTPLPPLPSWAAYTPRLPRSPMTPLTTPPRRATPPPPRTSLPPKRSSIPPTLPHKSPLPKHKLPPRPYPRKPNLHLSSAFPISSLFSHPHSSSRSPIIYLNSHRFESISSFTS